MVFQRKDFHFLSLWQKLPDLTNPFNKDLPPHKVIPFKENQDFHHPSLLVNQFLKVPPPDILHIPRNHCCHSLCQETL